MPMGSRPRSSTGSRSSAARTGRWSTPARTRPISTSSWRRRTGTSRRRSPPTTPISFPRGRRSCEEAAVPRPYHGGRPACGQRIHRGGSGRPEGGRGRPRGGRGVAPPGDRESRPSGGEDPADPRALRPCRRGRAPPGEDGRPRVRAPVRPGEDARGPPAGDAVRALGAEPPEAGSPGGRRGHRLLRRGRFPRGAYSRAHPGLRLLHRRRDGVRRRPDLRRVDREDRPSGRVVRNAYRFGSDQDFHPFRRHGAVPGPRAGDHRRGGESDESVLHGRNMTVGVLSGKEIVLGVTGGIAAYKACEILRELTASGANVRTILTASGAKFITPLTLQTLSKNTVVTDLFDLCSEAEIGHISLAQRADLLLIAPATANILGKIRGGIADDMLSTVVTATDAPVLLAPAMNDRMYA